MFFYRVGEQEYGSGGLLALISVGLWGVGLLAFKFGLFGNLGLQVGPLLRPGRVEHEASDALIITAIGL